MSILSKLGNRLRRSSACRLCRNEDGVTAIEFAVLAPLFFLLLGSIMETGIMLFSEYSLQTSVQAAGRLVRTGQAQEQMLTSAQFKNELCETAEIVIDCAGGVTVYMVSAADFTTLETMVPSYLNVGNSYGGPVNPTSYSCGDPSEVVAVIATYDWGFTMPFLKEHFGNVDGNTKRRLAGFAMFQNEPFPATGNTCPP
jgi:Flp pilus assembly protein TadG